MDQNDSLVGVLKIIYQRRKVVLGTTFIVAIASLIICLCLSNYYKSTTIFYPASPDLAKPSPVGPIEKDLDFYGQDEDLDRLFSISKSGELRSYLINKFNLYDHYEIDTTDIKAEFKLHQKFDKLFKSVKTKYNAVELSVEDKDKYIAMNMANDARNKIDDIAQRLIKESQKKLLNNYKNNINFKQGVIASLNDSLAKIREVYGVFNTTSQGDIFADIQSRTQSRLIDNQARLNIYNKDPNRFQDSIRKIKATISGLNNQLESINYKSTLFNKGYSKVVSLEFEQKEITQQLSLDKERQKQLLAAYNSPFTSLHLVDEAVLPVVKSWPKRSILILGATAFAFLMSILGVLVFNAYRNIDWKEVTNES